MYLLTHLLLSSVSLYFSVFCVTLDIPSSRYYFRLSFNCIWAYLICMEQEVILLGEESVIVWELNQLEKKP